MIENQLDTSMKEVFLGFSKVYTLYDSGCLVHCIARILNLPRLEVHQKLKDDGCFYNECLLDLTKIPLAYPQLTYTGKFTYDNNIALEAIKRNGIVIAEVDGNSAIGGTQQHFICMVGNGNIEDPLGGKIKPVTTYKTYLTLRVFEIKLPQEENMTEEQKNILKFLTEQGANEGKVREAFGSLSAVIEKDKQIQTLQARVLDLEKSQKDMEDRLTALESNIEADLKLITDWQSKCQTATKSLESANKSNIEMIAEKNRYKGLYEKALTDQVNKYTGWQLIKLGISKLTKK